MIWMRLTDFWGRKWMIVGGAILHILIFLLLFIKMTSVTIYITLFFMGLESPLLISLPFLLLIEIVFPSRRALFSMIMNFFDGLSPIILPLFYDYGKNWWILYWINMGITVLGLLVLLFFVKESPKFYVSVRKFEKAKEVYSHIAKTNTKEMFTNKL